MKVSLIQMCSGPNLEDNLSRCEALAREAKSDDTDWIVFPENAPFLGKTKNKSNIAEHVGDRVTEKFASLAKELESWITIGSFAEVAPDDSKTYNTQVHIAPTGQVIDTYRKMHLFDVDISGGGSFNESDWIEPGDETVLTHVSTDRQDWKVGLTICYDLRFPLIYRELMDQGAEIMTVPSAFTKQTGRAHWHALLRARAIENQCYIVAPNQWGHHNGSRYSFGQSVVYDPWGQIIACASEGEGVITAKLDRDYLEDVRTQIPTHQHRLFMPK